MKLSKLQTKGIDNFFSIVSKAVIFFPILIIAAAVVWKVSRTAGQIGGLSRTGKISPTAVPAETKISLNLNGPYVCRYSDKTTDISAYVKNGRAKVNTADKTGKKTSYFFDGDCFFTDGKKTRCGLATFVTIAESMAGGDITGSMGPLAQQLLGKSFDINKFIQGCRKEGFGDEIFR